MKSHLHGGAGFHLWARVSPGGRIVNMIRDSTSFTADVDGELQLGIYLGMWGDAFGRLDTPAGCSGPLARATPGLGVGPASRPFVRRDLPSAWFLQAR